MKTILMTLMSIFALTGCAMDSQGMNEATTVAANSQPYNRQSRISDIINDPAFGNFGRLLFPVDDSYWSGTTLEDLRLTWYNGIAPDKTVEIVNTLKYQAEAGQTGGPTTGLSISQSPFYNIYTEAEKQAGPDKRNTGLFFFKGNSGTPYAICNAVGALTMSAPCTTQSLMRSNSRRRATMSLHSSIAQGGPRPMKTSPAQ